MSEQEFELYLKLLSRCLGLTAAQREQIADELRDHLEERLEELVREGVPRDLAVIQAIDEFGDASVLAAHFTTIARMRRRRLVMRLSLGSVATLAAGLFVALALWPEGHALEGPARVVGETAEQAPPAAPRTTVEVARPIARDVADTKFGEGLTEPSRKVEVRSRVSGYLIGSAFENGGPVKKGDYLFYLDARPYEAVLARAKGQLEQAHARADRAKAALRYTEDLNKQKVVSEKEVLQRQLELKETEGAVASAFADVRTAQIDVDYAKLTAPIDGLLSRPKIDAGNLVTADQTVLAELTTLDPLTVAFKVDEATYFALRQAVRDGDVKVEDIPIEVAVSGENEFSHHARLESLQGDMHASSVVLRASLPNSDMAIVPGQKAAVRVTIGKPRQGLLVSAEAVSAPYQSPSGEVFVVGNDGTVEVRNIKLGGPAGNFLIVREGLKPDDRVVKSVASLQGVRWNEVKVEPVESTFEQ